MERDPDQRIYKYQIPIADEFSIKMPDHSVILHVGVQEKREERWGTTENVVVNSQIPCMWVKVNRVAPDVERKFYLVGTGHPLPVGATYHVGTISHGPFVWHLFEAESLT